MLTVHVLQPQGLSSQQGDPATLTATPELLWLDLFEPTMPEERAVEQLLAIDVPTREEMSEIESSNRLYEEDGGLYMTTTVLTRLDSDLPQNSQITFILKDGRLVTNRYCDPLAFKRYAAYSEKHPASCNSGIAIMAGLLEAMVNRIADGIERVGTDLDSVSVDVFTRPRRGGRDLSQRDYRRVLERIGQSGELIAKTRESPREPSGACSRSRSRPQRLRRRRKCAAGCAHCHAMSWP